MGLPIAIFGRGDETGLTMSCMDDKVRCPACGGSGGGPFGPAGSAWDTEDYVCPRCNGTGFLRAGAPLSARPGLAKAAPDEAVDSEKKASSG
jgi:hypothetical protein